MMSQSTDTIRSRRAQSRRRVLGIGLLVGVVVTIGGVVFVLGSASDTLRQLALLAIVFPLIAYVGWWALMAGLWRRDEREAARELPVTERLELPVLFDAAAGELPQPGSIRPHVPTSSADATEIYAASIRRPSGDVPDSMRPRFRAAG